MENVNNSAIRDSIKDLYDLGFRDTDIVNLLKREADRKMKSNVTEDVPFLKEFFDVMGFSITRSAITYVPELFNNAAPMVYHQGRFVLERNPDKVSYGVSAGGHTVQVYVPAKLKKIKDYLKANGLSSLLMSLYKVWNEVEINFSPSHFRLIKTNEFVHSYKDTSMKVFLDGNRFTVDEGVFRIGDYSVVNEKGEVDFFRVQTDSDLDFLFDTFDSIEESEKIIFGVKVSTYVDPIRV